MKVHLLSTEAPINAWGNTHVADCGSEVKNAKACFAWDEQGMGEGIAYSRNMCRECYLADKGPREKRIVYGITERTLQEGD